MASSRFGVFAVSKSDADKVCTFDGTLSRSIRLGSGGDGAATTAGARADRVGVARLVVLGAARGLGAASGVVAMTCTSGSLTSCARIASGAVTAARLTAPNHHARRVTLTSPPIHVAPATRVDYRTFPTASSRNDLAKSIGTSG